MTYIKVKNVKKLFHDFDKSIEKSALYAIDKKISDFIIKISTTFNGHHKRVSAKDIEMYKF